jgi:hypothetical protein
MRQGLSDREKTALVFLGKVIFEDKVESGCSDYPKKREQKENNKKDFIME